jgi:thiamine biosynthesis lipoprotein
MASLFELWLSGEDEEHLAAVAEAALDEIQRIERLLSRFDPAAEIYRVNQQAAHRPVLVDRELFAILQDCRRRFEQTEGYFNVCAPSLVEEQVCDNELSLTIDEPTRTVRLPHLDSFLDLGGFG